MARKRLLLEIGMGNDLHGSDYTKAATRAVQDAVHHSSVALIRSLGLDRDSVFIDVTIGAQKPDQVDTDAVAKTLPFGVVTVSAVMGGLDVPEEGDHDLAAIAVATIVVSAEMD